LQLVARCVEFGRANPQSKPLFSVGVLFSVKTKTTQIADRRLHTCERQILGDMKSSGAGYSGDSRDVEAARHSRSSFDETRRLMVLSSMVLVLHTGTGYLEELLFKELQFKSAFFMVLFMCVLYIVGYLSYGAVVGGAVIPPVLTSGVQRGDRFSMGLLCCAYLGSNSLSKLSLNFVSVPTMIVFKSCKLVCVMFGATVIMGKV